MKTTVSSHYRTFHHFEQRKEDGGKIDATAASVAGGTKDFGDSGEKFSLSWVRLASRKSIEDISACTACTQYKRIPKSQPVAEPTHMFICMAFSLFHNCYWTCVCVCVGVYRCMLPCD